MKKNFKKAMAAVMAASLMLSLAGNAAEADAAKKPKLAKKSVNVTVGQTTTVKIKNVKAKTVKKLSVKSANKKIVTAKKKGKTAVKVTGKKANKKAVKVTVSVTVKGQKKATKLTLKVTVKAKKPSVTPAASAPATSAPAASAPAASAPAASAPAATAGTPETSVPVASAPASSTPAASAPASGPSTNPGPSTTPTPTATPIVKEPTVDVVLEEDAINAESSTTAQVTVSEGDVKSVDWSVKDTGVASVQKSADDQKKATVTGVAEGETKVIAAVKVTVQGKEFEITKEADLLVVKKGSPIAKATIESAPAEIAVGETAGVTIAVTVNEAAVDTADILSAEWKVEGTAITVEGNGPNAVITAKELGEATLSVLITAKSGDATAYGKGKFKITVTPWVTYIIGKDIELDGDNWNAVFLTDLAKQIKVKKTDKVEVFFTSTEDDVQLVLSPWKDLEGKSTWNMREQAPFVSSSTSNGKAEFDLNEKFFNGIYSEINAIGANTSEQTTITIDKITVTPTDELAFAVQAPIGVEIGTPGVILAEVDEGYTLEWTSSDEKVATVTGDNTKGTVTGIENGTVTITVTVKSADGKEVHTQEINLDVTRPYKNINIPVDLADLSGIGSGDITSTKDSDGKMTSLTIMDENEGLSLALPNKLAKGDKLKVMVKGSFSADSKGFRLYAGTGGVNGSCENNGLGMTGDKVKEGEFTCEVELKATAECSYLCFRIPIAGGSTPVTGVTITEVTLLYL